MTDQFRDSGETADRCIWYGFNATTFGIPSTFGFPEGEYDVRCMINDGYSDQENSFLTDFYVDG